MTAFFINKNLISILKEISDKKMIIIVLLRSILIHFIIFLSNKKCIKILFPIINFHTFTIYLLHVVIFTHLYENVV